MNIKYICTLALIFFSILYTCAQTPILPMYSGDIRNVENAYYKDINNVHDQYVGTWLYTNGNTSLKIILRKRVMVYTSSHLANFYIDALIGEYQYIENGLEKVNTLNTISEEYSDISNHNLYAFSLMHKSVYPKCNECANNEKRLVMAFNEPSRRHLSGLSDNFIMRRYFVNGVEKLKVWFPYTGNGLVSDDNTGELSDINSFSLPYGEYILTKQ